MRGSNKKEKRRNGAYRDSASNGTAPSTGPRRVTQQTFDSEVVNAPTPVLIDFWAPWCGPCRAIAPALDALTKKWAGQVRVVKVNVDEEPELAAAFNIRSIPTLVAMRGRDVIDAQVGFGGPEALDALMARAAKAGGTDAPQASA